MRRLLNPDEPASQHHRPSWVVPCMYPSVSWWRDLLWNSVAKRTDSLQLSRKITLESVCSGLLSEMIAAQVLGLPIECKSACEEKSTAGISSSRIWWPSLRTCICGTTWRLTPIRRAVVTHMDYIVGQTDFTAMGMRSTSRAADRRASRLAECKPITQRMRCRSTHCIRRCLATATLRVAATSIAWR
jgi:hypothetical protein